MTVNGERIAKKIIYFLTFYHYHHSMCNNTVNEDCVVSSVMEVSFVRPTDVLDPIRGSSAVWKNSKSLAWLISMHDLFCIHAYVNVYLIN